MKRLAIIFILIFLLIGVASADDIALKSGVTSTDKTSVDIIDGKLTYTVKDTSLSFESSVSIDNAQIIVENIKVDEKGAYTFSSDKDDTAIIKYTYFNNGTIKETITLKEYKDLSFPITVPAGYKLIPWYNGQYKIVESSMQDTMTGIVAEKPFGIDASGRYIEMNYKLDKNTLILQYNTTGITYPLTIDPTWYPTGSSYYTYIEGNYTIIMWNATGVKNWTAPANVSSIEYLIVAGGGGGSGNGGGGGGAGGFLTGTTTNVTTGTIYNVTVGAGGTAGSSAPSHGGNGTDSTFSNISSTGGGGAGGNGAGAGMRNGSYGGSGGGGTYLGYWGLSVSGQGNRGGVNTSIITTGGGGGAGGVGLNGTATWATGGNGGIGLTSNISGCITYYAGGGGGGADGAGGSLGGAGGGGNGSMAAGGNGIAGVNGLGGGGGGGSSAGAAGGSGTVIIKFITPPDVWVPVIGEDGHYWMYNLTGTGTYLDMWNKSGTYNKAFPYNTTADYVVVAGGGAGGNSISGGAGNGGGGAGGTSAGSSFSISTASFTVIIGAGGVNGTTTTSIGGNGTNSSFGNVTLNISAIGGGGGGSYTGIQIGFPGGSGGGSTYGALRGTGTSGQGFNGGNGTATSVFGGGGGGGNQSVGGNGTATNGGAGGTCYQYTLPSGAKINLSGGGGGGIYVTGTAGGAGGCLVGGNGGDGSVGVNAVNGTGSGGGGAGTAGAGATFLGGDGSDGAVIIQYSTPDIESPVSSFTLNQTYGLFPLPVNFTSTSTNTPTLWNWSFGDGTWDNGTNFNVTKTYSTGGNFTVFLVSSNAGGANQSPNQYITVYNQTFASITKNSTYIVVPATKTVWFNGTNSLNATWYNWTLPNGTWLNGTQNVSYTFSTGGNYTINLTTSDSGYGSNTNYSFLNVYNQSYASFTANNTSGLFPLPVSFNVTVPQDNATVWNWSFGDGSPWENSTTTQNASHIYTSGGGYLVTQYASNPYSWMAYYSSVDYIVVYNRTNTTFTASNTSGISPLPVNFTDVSSNATSWYWNFGDGNTSTDRYPTKIYNVLGTFSVNHSSSNAQHTSWYNLSNYITVSELSVVSDFTSNVTDGVFVLGVGFNDTSSNRPTAWNWSFGDGTFASTNNTAHAYSSGGSYTVVLNATNSNTTFFSNKSMVITVWNTTTSGFSGNNTTGFRPLVVNFTDTSVNATTYYWNFGEGNTSTTKSPIFTYNVAGVFNVNHSTSNGHWTNWTNISNYITVIEPPKPIVNFTANTTTAYEGFPVGFTSDSVTNILTYNWTLNGTNFATTQNPVWTCGEIGVYSIGLNVTNATGFNFTEKTNYISCVPRIDNQFELSFTPSSATIANGTKYLLTSNIAKLSPNNASYIEVRITWDPKILNLSNFRGNTTYFATTYVNFTPPDEDEDFQYNSTYGYAYFGVQRTSGGFIAASSTQRPIVDIDVDYINYTQPATTKVNHTYGEYYESGTGLPFYVDNYYNATYSFTDWTINANFTSNVTSGMKPLSVQFNDTSSGYPNRWNWSWGDGTYTNATTQNASHTYSSTGTYTVALRSYLWQNNSVTSTMTKTNYITVSEPSPVADFTINATSGLFVLGIYANDTSSNTPLTWNWSFGDGTFASTNNVTHSYSSGGAYYLNLTVNNTNATKSSKNITITVYNRTSNDFVGAPTSGNVSFNVVFTDTSYNATSWFWMFGDGNTSTTQSPTFAYEVAGVYSVNHSSSNAQHTYWTNKSLYITAYPPYVAASYSNFTADVLTGPQPLSVQFTSDSNNTPTAWNWSFGDGNYSNLENPLYVYNVFGLHTVTLNASNANHTYHPTTKVNYINVTDGIPPLSITNLAYNNSTCQNTTWTWDNPVADYHHLIVYKNNVWHSNITAPTEVLVWSGITAGEFSSRTCDAAGNCNSTWVNMTAPDAAVCDITPPLAPVNLTNVTTCNQITWTWESQDADYYRVMVYRWNESDPLGDYFYGFVTEPTFTSTWTGLNQSTLYNISLLSMDAAGNVNYTWLNQTARTSYCTPVVDFSANETFGYIPFAVNFTDLSTGTATGWNWSFGDGNFSNDHYPNHIYNVVGLMTVTLNVSNPSGFNSTTKVAYINATATAYSPVSSFIMNTSAGAPPLGVSFTDTSTFGPTSWNWSFGDGTYNNSQHTEHLYSIEGVYHIILNATNAYGSNTSQQTLYVTNVTIGGGGSSSGSTSGTVWIEANTLMSFLIVTIPAVLIMVYLLVTNRKQEDE